ncbi:MAG: hypothetical protein ACRD3B_05955 [Candidatus Sulfotelmatobacter sp.]
MARGWESKAVEAQQADMNEKSAEPRLMLTPEAKARTRDRENLLLARRRVLQQLEFSKNPRHQKQLRDSVAALDERLKTSE